MRGRLLLVMSVVVTALVAATPEAKASVALGTDRLVVSRTGLEFGAYAQIYSIKTDGTDPRRISPFQLQEHTWQPRLSPDRQTVIYYSGVPEHADKHALWIANADGSGTPSLLIPKGGWPGFGWEVHGHAEWSHDNRYLVMSAGSKHTPQIWVLDLLATTPVPSLRSYAHPDIAHVDPSFHSDGQTILYARCEQATPCRGTDREIYLMASVVAGDTVLDLQKTDDAFHDGDPHFSPDGDEIVFRRYVGCNPQIYTKPGAAGPGVPAVPVVNDGDVNDGATWDATSTTLYYDRYPGDSYRQLAKISRNGGAVTPIGLNGNCGEDFPNLTQNSTSAASSAGPGALAMDRMVVSTVRTDGPTASDHANREIYSMKLDGTAQTRLTTSPPGVENWWAQLSPDRQKILFYRGGTENDVFNISLWIMNSDGTNAYELIPKQGPPGLPAGWSWYGQGHASWSPNGQKIVMLAFAQGTPQNPAPAGAQIWTTTQGGQVPVQVTTTQPSITHIDPSWWPDGQRILYVRCPQVSPCGPGNQEVYITSAAGDQFGDYRLTQDTYPDYDPFAAPNGTEFAWLRNVACFRWGIFKASAPATSLVTPTPVIDNQDELNSLPAWSRDSQWIYFHRNITPVQNVWKVESDGSPAPTELNTGADHCGVREPNQSSV